ncbi:hypothetical protein ACVI1L_004662 [Bradyrhizobium sp. USDA 4516]
MVRWPTAAGSATSKPISAERIDKYIDHANRAALVNQVVEAFGAAASAPTVCFA